MQEARTGLLRTGACEASALGSVLNRKAIGPISVVASDLGAVFSFLWNVAHGRFDLMESYYARPLPVQSKF